MRNCHWRFAFQCHIGFVLRTFTNTSVWTTLMNLFALYYLYAAYSCVVNTKILVQWVKPYTCTFLPITWRIYIPARVSSQNNDLAGRHVFTGSTDRIEFPKLLPSMCTSNTHSTTLSRKRRAVEVQKDSARLIGWLQRIRQFSIDVSGLCICILLHTTPYLSAT